MEVFVNQEKIGDHTGSYTLYRVDVTDQISKWRQQIRHCL